MIVDIDLSPLTVLVIDDNRYARAFLKSALASFGIRTVVETGDGLSGLALLRERKIDLVLVDNDMSPMNGIDFTRLVRAGIDLPRRDLPIIMVSGVADMEKVGEARNAGVTEFLVKPVSADSLFRRVRNALVNPRPFVAIGSYVGPCRRSVQRAVAATTDRRHNPPLPRPAPMVPVPPPAAVPPAEGGEAAARVLARRDRISRRHFKAGAAIFVEGEAGDEAYVVETGRVVILGPAGDGGKVLGEVGPRGIFGEMALIDDHPRSASARAVQDCVCMVVPRAALKAQIGRSPDLVILVAETLLHNIRKMGHDLIEMRARGNGGSAR